MEHMYSEVELKYWMAQAAIAGLEGYKEGLKAGRRSVIKGIIIGGIVAFAASTIVEYYKENDDITVTKDDNE